MPYFKYVIISFMLIPFVTSLQCDIVLTESTERKVKIANCKNIGLTKVPTFLPNDINILDLSENNIKNLSNYDFERYRILEKLIIKKNKLHHIEEKSFVGLNRLKFLDMSENKLNLLHSYTSEKFLPLVNLTNLDIRRNIKQPSDTNLYHYPDNAFAVLEQLNFFALDMAPNPSFGKGFRILKKLKSLTFELCFLKYLNKSVFENFSSNINELNLTGCRLHLVHVENDILLPFPKMTKLNLEGTCMHLKQALNILSPYSGKRFKLINFGGLSCPVFNNENNNFVLTITKEMMQYLKTICVEWLHLSDNGIVDFEKDSLLSFDRPECIEHIFFKGNRFAFSKGRQMDEIKSFFQNSKNLKTLDYSYIPVRYELSNKDLGRNVVHEKQQSKSSEVIIFPRSLETLLLSNVLCYDFERLLLIPEGSNLTYLDLSFGFSLIGILFQKNSSQKIETLLIDGHPHSTFIDQEELMNNGKIKTLKWRDASLYIHMYPDDKQYSSMIQSVFKKLKYLENLDMSKNSLWFLPENLLQSMKYLSELRLSKNLFHLVPRQIMDLSNIKLLDFRQNLLTTLDKNTRIWADSMNQKQGLNVLMADNAFECKCDNLDFIEWINKTKVKLDSRSYKCTLVNGSLITVREAYEKMHDLFLHCESSIWLTVASTLLSTCFVTALLFFIYGKRWEISLFFYRQFRKILKKKYCRSFTYDVFVSYGGDSVPWIKNYLVPKLEHEWKLKICFKDRDFLPGGSYFDTEAESIENSRHVIFLLTPSFKASEDYLFAVERVKHEKRIRNIENIIVLAKDISLKNIPTELTYIWNYVSFIQWTDDTDDIDIMWQQLRLWICQDFM
ncbi:toll-like receptor 1 [Mytilus californianus]|uniref:toll-like receptor 1 n=1 Tax=Mytilus californianus TaxID=6549 RepID=UPI0022459AFA|nr:toll-like receptor 1 [Mytilus californianus]XP_052100829.1 toll-like receptor 1 [Mytilus californianus]